MLYQLPILPDHRLIAFGLILLILFSRKSGLRFYLCFIGGFIWALYRADLILDQELPQILEGQDLNVKGTVVGLPNQSPRRQQFLFDVESMNVDGHDVLVSYRFKLNWYHNSYGERLSEPSSEIMKANEIKAGGRWQLTVRVKRPNGFINPGGRDYEASLFQQGINSTGYVRNGHEIEHYSISLMQKIHLWRSEIYHDLKASLPRLSGIVPALGLGIKDDLSSNTWKVLIATGTIHLTAISGLHIGLISALFFFVGRWLWSIPVITLHWISAKKMGALFAMIAAVFYAAMAGFSIPTQRALIMVLTIMFCLLSDRDIPRFDIVLIALFSVLIFSPASVISPGFWLSFAAVSIIFYTVSGRIKTAGFWQKTFKIHFIIALGLFPLLASFFGQNPLLGPLANIIAVPFFSLLITPLVLLGLLSLKVYQPVGEALLKLTDFLIDSFWPYLEWIASLPYTTLQLNISSTGILIISLLGVILLLMPRGLPGRWLAGIFFLPAFLIQPSSPEQGEFELTLLDVGQGLSVVIRTSDHVLVYDAGAKFSDNFDAGAAVIVPFLRSMGIKSLDKVIISHADNDHRGGYQSLAEEMLIIETLTSTPEKIQGNNIDSCQAGQHWSWDNVTFTILHPEEDYLGKGNNRSCVLKIDNGYRSVLLTGDIEAVVESVLVAKKGRQLDVDLLVAPHHGSKTSSTDAFLVAVSPEYALFSTGYQNRYHHPDKSIVVKYREKGIKLLDTAAHGAITFQVGKVLSSPNTYRQNQGHFWTRNHVE